MIDFIKIVVAGILDSVYGLILAAFYPVFVALGHPELAVLLFIIFTVIPVLATYIALISTDLKNPIPFLAIFFTLIVELASLEQLGWLLAIGAILNIIVPFVGIIIDEI